MRYFLLVGFLVLALFLWRRALRGAASAQDEAPPPAQKMVLCRRCGTYLPENESVLDDGNYYCSPEHRDQDRKLDS